MLFPPTPAFQGVNIVRRGNWQWISNNENKTNKSRELPNKLFLARLLRSLLDSCWRGGPQYDIVRVGVAYRRSKHFGNLAAHYRPYGARLKRETRLPRAWMDTFCVLP